MGKHVVTGAFGYSGKYIATRLLDQGVSVHTITNSPERANPFGGRVSVSRFNFDDPKALISDLENTDVLYNTYWVRFDYGDFTHSLAVENTLKLFAAAAEAGVRRIVHVSITNPSEDSDLRYFSGKARLERKLRESDLSYSILRPTVLFGKEDILVNNIAWVLRRLPFFGVFGDGSYRLQPIYVDDLAALAIHEGRSKENHVVDAIGPETFTFLNLVKTIGATIGKRRPTISVSPRIGHFVASIIGKIVGDVFLTREEIEGLMRNHLYTESQPAGHTKLTDWARAHSAELGLRYSSELARRQNRVKAYESL